MCGIAGVQALGAAAPVSDAWLSAMAGQLRHRGPDDSGTWLAPGARAGLTATRLAITDATAQGAQPMTDPSGRWTLVFNGEIFNAAELRRDLSRGGCRFRSAHGDTEVLLQAWARWGLDALDRVRGMYAFALWDAREAALWLVRDPFGIKPLYWADTSKHFIFASEPGAIFATGLLSPRASDQGVADWLTLLAVPPPRTLFEGVFTVPAGAWRRVAAKGGVAEGRFADPCAGAATDLAPEAALEVLSAHLDRAMSRALPSNGPAALMLSGGVDSGLIAVAAGRYRSSATRFVTMSVSGGPDGDEAAAAEKTARRIGASHEVIASCESDIADAIAALATIRPDAPCATPDMALTYLFARRMARDGVRICLQGEGADETFGYASHQAAFRAFPALRWFNRLPSSIQRLVMARASSARRARLDPARGDRIFPARHVQAFDEIDKAALWRGGPVASSFETAGALVADISGQTAAAHLDRLVALEFRLRLPEFLLARSDLATMAAGVEARLPFLDLDLVRWALGLSPAIRMRNSCAKWPLKALFAQSVGRDHAFRHKQGYGRVLSRFLNVAAPSRLASMLDGRSDHPLYGLVRPEAVARLMAPGPGRDAYRLWTLWALASWLERVPSLAPKSAA